MLDIKSRTAAECPQRVSVDLQGLDAIETSRIEGAFVVAGERREFSCDLAAWYRSPMDWSVGCDQQQVWINSVAYDKPKEIQLEVVVDGGAFKFSGTVRPTYHVRSGCGTCTSGTATATLTPGGAR